VPSANDAGLQTSPFWDGSPRAGGDSGETEQALATMDATSHLLG
jgi:hypothetical protein